MAMNVQTSASTIGMAPTATTGGAGQGSLPSLTGGAAADPNVGSAPAGGGIQTPGTQAQQAPAPAMNPLALTKHGTWLGPLMTIGGGIAAIAAFAKGQDGSKFMKFGGVAAALGGVGMTALGFQAKGVEVGTKKTEAEALVAMQQLQTQYEATMQNLSTQASTEITTLRQQLEQAKGQGGTNGPTGQTSGAGIGVGPGLDTTVVPGGRNGQAPIGGDPSTQTTTSGPQSTNPTTPSGPWSPQSLVGTSVELAAGASASGATIADAGTYQIEQLAGDANGYATADEANAAARQSMSTELMGSKFLRWMVVEHDGRFYGAVAKQSQGAGATPLTPAIGNVVAWSAMNHVEDNGVNGWQAYSWSKTSGQQSIAVPYGTDNVFAGVAGGGPAPSGTAPSGTTGTVAVAPTGGTSFDPATQVGRTFSINASTTEAGSVARGGVLQVQRFVASSAGGFGTAEEAAVAARAARASSGDASQWSRWVTLQGSDGRHYVYEGSIVKRATAELEAAPVHVFGTGFAEYFDGATNAWKAIADSSAA